MIPIQSKEDIPRPYQNTPIGLLLEYHNLGRSHDHFTKAQMLIGMCMDYRKRLSIPENFAYVMRTGGADFRESEFKISFAIAVGGVSHLALIGHDQCGMANLASKKEVFIDGLVQRAGWNRNQAEAHFLESAPKCEIHDEINFVLNETHRLRLKYPNVLIAPMLYQLEDHRLYLLAEKEKNPLP